MTRAVLPNTSAREQWLLARLIDRAVSHWVRAPPLDGGNDDEADTETDTTAPNDDDDDITSLCSQPPAAVRVTGW